MNTTEDRDSVVSALKKAKENPMCNLCISEAISILRQIEMKYNHDPCLGQYTGRTLMYLEKARKYKSYKKKEELLSAAYDYLPCRIMLGLDTAKERMH